MNVNEIDIIYNFLLICKGEDKICYSIIGYTALIRTLNLIG